MQFPRGIQLVVTGKDDLGDLILPLLISFMKHGIFQDACKLPGSLPNLLDLLKTHPADLEGNSITGTGVASSSLLSGVSSPSTFSSYSCLTASSPFSSSFAFLAASFSAFNFSCFSFSIFSTCSLYSLSSSAGY